jgi:hypothetical protein
MKKFRDAASRRGFLIAAASGGIAGAATLLAGSRHSGQQPSATKTDANTQGRGYRVTDHVRNYYRTTKI